MTIQIEDYYGNDLITLCYNQVLFKKSENEFNLIDEIVQVNGYNVADLDDDVYYRVQAVEVLDDEVKAKDNLLTLVTRLNNQFL
jgi:hypothetical protein